MIKLGLHAEDITGQRFGRLIVIKPIKRDKNSNIIWQCICDCGKYKAIYGNSLRNNTVKSCGCLQKNNFIENSIKKMLKKIGQKKNLLEIIDIFFIKTKKQNYNTFLCVCLCGELTFCRSSEFKLNHKKSCGCYNRSSNSKLFKEQHPNWNFNRQEIKLNQKIHNILRNFINRSLKSKKQYSKHKYLNYSVQEFLDYNKYKYNFDLNKLGNQLKDLTFDHKIPISFWIKNGFTKPSDSRYIHSLYNLQMITFKQNRKKWNKIDKKLCLKTLDLIIKQYPEGIKRLLKLKIKLEEEIK